MSQFFQSWFSSGSKSNNGRDGQTSEASHKLVAACLESLPVASISPGDYYRLYRTLLDWSCEHRVTANLSGRTRLALRISPFDCILPTNISSTVKQLQLESVNGELVRWLVRTFPAVKKLELYVQTGGYELNQSTLQCLLFEPIGSNWARQLTVFILDGQRVDKWRACLPKLTVANFPQLTTLFLSADRPPDGYDPAAMAPLDIPILSQLTNFSIFIQGYNFGIIWPTLKEHVNDRPPPEIKRFWPLPPVPQPRSYSLYQPLTVPLVYEVICTIVPHFAVHVPCPTSSSLVLRSLARKFSSLEHLILSFEKRPNKLAPYCTLIQLLQPLSQLVKLNQLKLNLKSYKQLPVAGERIPPDVKLSACLKQVNIEINRVRHGIFHVPTIVAGLFPAARPVGLYFLHCETCRINLGSDSVDCCRQVTMDASEGDVQFKWH